MTNLRTAWGSLGERPILRPRLALLALGLDRLQGRLAGLDRLEGLGVLLLQALGLGDVVPVGAKGFGRLLGGPTGVRVKLIRCVNLLTNQQYTSTVVTWCLDTG